MGFFSKKTPPAPEQELIAGTEENFRMLYSRFKVEILLADGNALCHYGNEANATVAQMMDGSATEVRLNARQAFLDCVAFVQRYRTNIAVAVIYRRHRALRRWYPVRTYGPWGELLQRTPLKWEKHITRCSCEVKNGIIHLTDIEVLSK